MPVGATPLRPVTVFQIRRVRSLSRLGTFLLHSSLGSPLIALQWMKGGSFCGRQNSGWCARPVRSGSGSNFIQTRLCLRPSLTISVVFLQREIIHHVYTASCAVPGSHC